ncbi:alpha/beta hydrolase [Lentisalinibacter sediminis]|uniref:alpha/beta hydrolase n=1 Tax=Lentisalinibacter sediminis TaxID=2992237 RepID=UPI00386A99D2
MLKLLSILLGFYLLFVGLVYAMQGRLLYLPNLPGRELDATPADIGLAYEDVQLTADDGVKLHGWFVPAADSARGTLLFFHGNAGNISHRLESISQFHGLGLDVLIIDYRGYGQSEGSPSERGTYRDAEAAWQYLTEERGVAPSRMVVFGRSVGGAVGAWLAANREAGALIVESSFSSLPALAGELYWFLPVRWLSRFRYPTAEYVAAADCPVLVIHSREDDIVPFHHGRAIYESAGEPRRFLELSGPHNGAHVLSEERYLDGLREFLATALPPM